MNRDERLVHVPVHSTVLEGSLDLPAGGRRLVLFADRWARSRPSAPDRLLAHVLRRAGIGTLLVDLVTAEEALADGASEVWDGDVALLGDRLVGILDWLGENAETAGLRVGLFGAGTGAAAALLCAGERPDAISAVVSRGGRLELADEMLGRVRAPTLLLVGAGDEPVLRANRKAAPDIAAEVALVIIPGATHFEEPGAPAEAATRAARWFLRHLVEIGAPARV